MTDGVQFQVGDTVQLKSGGPKMTVVDAETGPGRNAGVLHVYAGWFAGAKYEKARFDVRALMTPPADKPKDK